MNTDQLPGRPARLRFESLTRSSRVKSFLGVSKIKMAGVLPLIPTGSSEWTDRVGD